MQEEAKTKKPRTPRNYDSIEKGALSLSLEDRARLVSKLKDSIRNEVDEAKDRAEQAAKLATGL